ncbi:hypothetical protein IscW_ISCW007253 [Ixodes scapularis]|uniref:Secreted protein n=1 Tax=Ixodes scapularis TaxID=6945 RepID=B7PVG6_IXOSC|nr:hypothetical protein IscW_ISCW007253 [Ixodes scapularis]|eukprot:XP_002407923.1 hypothetical protein IscW_ISCW007253 [Ixodes scapularis]
MAIQQPFFSKKCSCTIVVLLLWLVHIVARAHCPCCAKQLHLMGNKLIHEVCVESILIITTGDM